MAISMPPAKPWGDPTEAVRSLVRQLAAAGEADADEGLGAGAGVLARGRPATAALCIGCWAARLEPEHAQVVTPVAARMAIRNGFIFADPFWSSGTPPDPSHPAAAANGSALMITSPTQRLTWPDDRLCRGVRGGELPIISARRHAGRGSQAAPIEYDQASSRSLSLAKRDALSPEGNRQQDPRRQDMTLSDDKEQDHA
jgi:hypothetical protein